MFLKAALAVIVVMALAGVWMKFEINTLTIANINLTTERDAAVESAEALETTITVQAEAIAANAEKMREMDTERLEAQKQVEYMRSLFAGHDFANLLAKKPGLIENRMIKKTAEVLNDLEAVSQ
jgi:hypothetical protein